MAKYRWSVRIGSVRRAGSAGTCRVSRSQAAGWAVATALKVELALRIVDLEESRVVTGSALPNLP